MIPLDIRHRELVVVGDRIPQVRARLAAHFAAVCGRRLEIVSAAQPLPDHGLADGFQEFLVALRDEVVAFKKPVAYVHGDSHYFRTDRPMLDSLGRRLENFTRVETFGDNVFKNNPEWDNNNVHWVKVLVDSRTREVFSYQVQIVPGNRVAVPAP